MDAQLRNLVVPESLHCRDLHCKDDQHLADSDDFIKAVLNSVDFAANSCIPLAKSKRERSLCKAGWSEYVKPFRDKAFFWHQVWLSAGRPINCQLHLVMKHTRNVYHYEVRKIKRSEQIIKKNRLLDACLNGNGEIFNEVKKLRSHKSQVASSVDGVKGDISTNFMELYIILWMIRKIWKH